MKTKTIFLTLLTGVFLNLNAQNLTFEWANKMGGTSEDVGLSIVTDANGNVYSTGYFGGTADFDPSLGVMNLNSKGDRDIFIQKLDEDGNLLWVKEIGGIGRDVGFSIDVDVNGSIYITGYFQGVVDFDPDSGITNLTANGGIDIFIQKLNKNGKLLWVKQMSGTGIDVGLSINIDLNGNIYSTGYFQSVVDFDPNSGITNLTSNGDNDIFINKLDSNGNLLWAKQIFKTKPNHEVDAELKTKIKTVFHHLTKDELIEKLLANYLLQNKNEPVEKPVKRQKMK
jgi:hypothetical protein